MSTLHIDELTPTDYIDAVRLYSNKYLVDDPATQEVVLGFEDFEYALVWRGEDQCFFPRFGRIVSPEDSQMFRLVARHWRRMDKKSQNSWMQTICQILNVEYEEESSSSDSSEDSSDED